MLGPDMVAVGNCDWVIEELFVILHFMVGETGLIEL